MSLSLNQENKSLVQRFWQALDEDAATTTATAMDEFLHRDLAWHGFDPVNDLRGTHSFLEDYWLPLNRSFLDLERETHIFFGGKSKGRIDGLRDGHMWVCGTGYLHGSFNEDYLTIPATGGHVSIRWGEFCRLEDGKIVEIYMLLDLIDLMEQAGVHVLPPCRGKAGLYPPPKARDGILLDSQDESETEVSLEHIRRFLFNALNAYDQSELKSMGMADYFHPDVQWYGPGGIGACLGLRAFETQHQQPWLHAFASRQVQNLDSLIAEGSYTGVAGFRGVKTIHTGEYLGCPPTSRNLIDVNGLDFWKRDGDQLIENWVFVDMIHLFRQLGVDLLKSAV